MTRTRRSKISRGTILAVIAAALCLSVAPEARAHARRRVCRPAHRVVVVRPVPVRVRPAPVVVVRPVPAVVRYVPARHVEWVRGAGYGCAPGFGYPRHVLDPRGVLLGVHLRF